MSFLSRFKGRMRLRRLAREDQKRVEEGRVEERMRVKRFEGVVHKAHHQYLTDVQRKSRQEEEIRVAQEAGRRQARRRENTWKAVVGAVSSIGGSKKQQQKQPRRRTKRTTKKRVYIEKKPKQWF